MRRRTLLRAGALAGLGALAGCVDDSVPGGTPTRGPDTPGGPATPAPEFEVLERSCGQGENEATVEFRAGAVAVEGTIRGSDTCDTATLSSARMRDGELVVAVATAREFTGTPACAQCITDIDYLARIGDVDPDRVVVTHDGETVTTARP